MWVGAGGGRWDGALGGGPRARAVQPELLRPGVGAAPRWGGGTVEHRDGWTGSRAQEGGRDATGAEVVAEEPEGEAKGRADDPASARETPPPGPGGEKAWGGGRGRPGGSD